MKQKQERRVHLWYKAAVVHFKACLGLRSGVVPKPSESSDMTVPLNMKSYSFSKVSARGYLTEADYNNKYIFSDDLKQIINVSGRPLEKPLSFFRERDLIARNMPITDKDGDMGFDTLLMIYNCAICLLRKDSRK